LSAHHPSPHVHGSHVQPRPSIQPPQHYVQIPAQPAPVDTSAYSKLQIDQAWTEHAAPNSTTKYYYNAITKESTYTKPDCLVKKVKDMHINETETPKQQLRNQTTWAEYTDASSGKTYYSNGITTTWERPAEMGGDAESEEDEAPKKKKRKKNVENEVTEFNNSAEATAAFKGMLLAKGVQPTTNWNEVVKMCSSDSRWQACEILTLGERKQALAEYQTKRANELRTLERQERMRAKEAFTQLLMEKLVTIEEFSATTSQFADMRNLLASDDRFYAVEKEETRESLFLDFCEEVRKREERKKRSKKREAKDEFLAFLKEREEEGLLTFACTWASFIGTLEESHRNDPRFQASPALPEPDRELCFADYVLELQAAEEDRRRRIRDARRRAEKAQKEAYTEALRKMAYEGSLLPSSRWHTVEPLITADPSFAPVQAHDRESPREIFEDFVDEWNIVYRRDRSFLSNLSLSSSKQSLSVHPNMTYDEFSRALLDQAAHSPDLYGETRGILNREDPISSARLYFNELLSQARESQGQAAKRSKSGSRRGTTADSSSEDEGEIREEGEVVVDEEDANMTTAENASDEPE
jgi:pre-mRNA-processing factor 40